MTARDTGWALAGAFMALALVAVTRGEFLAALAFVTLSIVCRKASVLRP